MAAEQKLCFVLVPRKPSVEEIAEYAKGICAKYPEAEILIFKSVKPGEDYSVLYQNPQISLHTTHRRLDVVAAGYCAMAIARAMEFDWAFFNTGIRRYKLGEFLDFVEKSNPYLLNVNLTYGVPPILRPSDGDADSSDKMEAALAQESVRHRLLTDLFINYVFCTGLQVRGGFANLNAGIFGISRTAAKYLLNVVHYEDSSLLCSQIFWHLRHGDTDFRIKGINVSDIDLTDLGFSLKKAVREITFALWELMRVGRQINVRALAGMFFGEPTYWNQWVDAKDSTWFFADIIPQVEKSLAAKR